MLWRQMYRHISLYNKVTFLRIMSWQKGTASVALQAKLTLSPVIWNTLNILDILDILDI